MTSGVANDVPDIVVVAVKLVAYTGLEILGPYEMNCEYRTSQRMHVAEGAGRGLLEWI